MQEWYFEGCPTYDDFRHPCISVTDMHLTLTFKWTTDTSLGLRSEMFGFKPWMNTVGVKRAFP